MIKTLTKSVFGTTDERTIKKMSKDVKKINSLESEIEKLEDLQLKGKTEEFKMRITNGESLDSVLPEAFAVVREATKRVLGMRHYDVQLIGGMILHSGKISEMKTGEGKTLMSTLPIYLNALTGKGVHVITVNDYLAKRDRDTMSELYDFLGLSSGVVVANISPEERKAAYEADVTYGTNNEFGFDYLRDNMVHEMESRSKNIFLEAITKYTLDQEGNESPIYREIKILDTKKVDKIEDNIVYKYIYTGKKLIKEERFEVDEDSMEDDKELSLDNISIGNTSIKGKYSLYINNVKRAEINYGGAESLPKSETDEDYEDDMDDYLGASIPNVINGDYIIYDKNGRELYKTKFENVYSCQTYVTKIVKIKTLLSFWILIFLYTPVLID